MPDTGEQIKNYMDMKWLNTPIFGRLWMSKDPLISAFNQ